MKHSFKNLEEFKAACGYEIDGSWYPRVTRIVDMKAKPALLKFYANMGYDKAQLISQRSAKEGTMVHEAVEDILLNNDVKVANRIKPSIDAFSEFILKTPIRIFSPDYVERLVFNKTHGYAGTMDVLAEIDGKLGVLDVKTSDGIYRDFNLQTAAYYAALADEFDNLSARWILRIDQSKQCLACGATLRIKGGRKKLRPANGNGHLFGNGFHAHYGVTKMCGDDEHNWGQTKGIVELKEITDSWEDDFKAFLGAKELWEWEHKDWLKKIR